MPTRTSEEWPLHLAGAFYANHLLVPLRRTPGYDWNELHLPRRWRPISASNVSIKVQSSCTNHRHPPSSMRGLSRMRFGYVKSQGGTWGLVLGLNWDGSGPIRGPSDLHSTAPLDQGPLGLTRSSSSFLFDYEDTQFSNPANTIHL